ncbi:MAG: leucine-rich repeat domain-containing protein [Clostridia bacterium]|nr:leucine-rich repeat domain-containing protein [Clostridia bacterium]
MAKKKRAAFTAAIILAIFALAACLPFLSGCSASLNFELNPETQTYTVSCTGYKRALSGELVIPETYGSDNLPVTEVDENGFAGSGITKLVLPKSVAKIGEKAFNGCAYLTEITFAENGLKSIGAQAFRGTGISTLTIPASVEEIGIAAFANSPLLATASFASGNKMTKLPQSMLAQSEKLTFVGLPANCEEIGPLAMLGCTALTTITLPQTLKVIGARSFEDCAALSEITLHDGITTIGELAFYGTALEEITVPASVTDIYKPVLDEDGNPKKDEEGNPVTRKISGVGYGAFHTCESLKTAKIYANIEAIEAGTFGYCPKLESVYLPASVKKVEGPLYYTNGKLYVGHAFHNCAALKDIYFSGTKEQWKHLTVDKTTDTSNGGSYNNNAFLIATVHYI